MQAVSNEFKELAKSNARISLAKFVIKDSNTEIDGETIIDGFIEEMTCDNTSLVGNVMAKNLETSIYNNFTNDFIGKEIYAYTGQQLEDGTEEYVSRGTFIIDESEEDVSSGALKLKGLDYTIKFNKAWEDPLDWENNTYTLGDFAKTVCEFCGLELETEEFSNSDYVLTEQPAFEGYQCRYVMQKIAEIATSNVFISPEDKVQIRLAPQNYVSAEGSSITLEESANSRLKIDEFDGEITQETTILPSEYTQVEYIESSGTQYIDTNFKPNQNTRVVLDFINKDTTGSFLFGARISYSDNSFTLVSADGSNVRSDYGANQYNYARTVGTRYVFDKNKNIDTLFQNGTQINTHTFTATTINPNLNLYLFSTNNNGTAGTCSSIKLYSCKIYNNGTLVRDYIPCYNSSNVIGLYDLINNVFYTNKGTGTFIKGSNSTIPNPGYPQDINTVSGDKEVVVKGYNLLDFSSYSQESKATVNTDGSVTLNGAGGFALNFKEIEVKQGITYSTFVELVSGTITGNPPNGTGLMSPLGKGNWLSNNTQDVYIPNSNANRHTIWVGNQGTYNNARFRIWAYVGSTPLPYKPYQSQNYPLYLGVKNLSPINSMSTINGGYVNASTGHWGDVIAGKTYTVQFKNNSSYTNQIDVRVFHDNTYTSQLNKNLVANGIVEFTFTASNTGYIAINSKVASDVVDIFTEIKTTEGSHIQYITNNPIELCKIPNTTYQDYLGKSDGRNLCNATFELGGIDTTTGQNGSGTDRVRTKDYVEVKPNTTYTLSGVQGSRVVCFYNSSKAYLSYAVAGSQATSGTFTTSNNTAYIRWYIIQTNTNIYEMLNEGSTALPYEPYGKVWYLHKEIGKVVLDENTSVESGTGYVAIGRFAINGYIGIAGTTSQPGAISTHFTSRFTTDNGSIFTSAVDKKINVINTAYSGNYAGFKTWLEETKPIVYYILSTPTNTEITNDNYPELYSQLKAIEKARSMEGITYIDVDSSNLPFKLSLQYDKKDVEDIDINSIMSLEVEDTSYKPYNAVTLALADGIEGENVTLRDESSIALYGERALVITANEFAINQAVREELIEEMFNSINGFNYVPMKLEYNSYDWLERYDRIKVQYDDDKYYETYLFNHTTEFPSTIKSVIEDVAINETKVKYEFVPEEQQKTLHAEVVVDKLNGAVQALASESEDNFSSIRLDIDGIKSEVQSLNVENDELGNEINVLRSSITEQTSTAITDWFNTALKSTIENLENSAESNDQALNEIKSYVRRGVITDPTSPYYNQAFVELGDTTNQTTLRILPNRIQFLTNGQETAFISNNQLYINESTILTKEKVGHWVTTEDENGLLNTYWED